MTTPFFAVDRVNLAGPADLTIQPPDTERADNRAADRRRDRHLLGLLARHEPADTVVPVVRQGQRFRQLHRLLRRHRLQHPIEQRRVHLGAASVPDRRGRLRRRPYPARRGHLDLRQAGAAEPRLRRWPQPRGARVAADAAPVPGSGDLGRDQARRRADDHPGEQPARQHCVDLLPACRQRFLVRRAGETSGRIPARFGW